MPIPELRVAAAQFVLQILDGDEMPALLERLVDHDFTPCGRASALMALALSLFLLAFILSNLLGIKPLLPPAHQ